MCNYQVGIVGCGAIFVMHAAPLRAMPNTELVAVCDIDPRAAQLAAELFHCQAFTDYREMLARATLDTVHVCTPHYLHPGIAIDAMRAGKHVLTEKPMAITLADAQAMLAAADANQVTLGVISQNRYNAASVAIKEALAGGSLGKLIGESIVLTWYRPDNYYENSPWHGTWDKEGGSLIIDQAIHTLDLARWFVDAEIECVEASIRNRFHPKIETEDTAEGLIQYKNGARTVFYATNNYTMNSPNTIEIQCEKGTARLSFMDATITYTNGRELAVTNDPNDSFTYGEFAGYFDNQAAKMAFDSLKAWGIAGVPIPPTWRAPRPYWGFSHVRQLRNFYQSLDAGVRPDVDGREALKTQQMICAIYQSGKTGERVYVG